MPKLILVRHGQTEYNAQMRYQGSVDIPLNAEGLAQAATLASPLSQYKLDAIYTSDLSRARQTAAIALQNYTFPDRPANGAVGPAMTALQGLREINGGKFEGLTFKEISSRFPQEVDLWQKDRVRYGPPGGENAAQVVERVEQVLKQILREHPEDEKIILIVAHGGVIGILLCYLMGMDLNRAWQWRIDNCSLTILDLYSKGAILSEFNNSSHLKVSGVEDVGPNPAAGQTARNGHKEEVSRA